MTAPPAAPAIGSVRLENPFALAPMAGLSDPPFRRLCRRGGAGLVCAEMVSANALHYGDPRSRRMLEVFPDEHPVSVQIFGADPSRLANAARRAADAGADIVDLNGGCPVPKITCGGAGIRLMDDETHFGRCVEEMARAVKVPVTVKIRLGRRRGENRAARFARVAESAGAAAVSVHARSMEDRHSGPPDLAALAETVHAVTIPVFGNGGVRTGKDAHRMMKATGCAGVMVGQAAVGNPLIFNDFIEYFDGHDWVGIQDPTQKRKNALNLLREHAKLNVSYYGEERGISRLRKCLAAYFRDFPGAAEFRAKVYAAETLRDLLGLVCYFEEILTRGSP